MLASHVWPVRLHDKGETANPWIGLSSAFSKILDGGQRLQRLHVRRGDQDQGKGV